MGEAVKRRYSIDAFCEDTARDFNKRINDGMNYSGIFIYGWGKISLRDLNFMRNKIREGLDEKVRNNYLVITALFPIRTMPKYDSRNPEREGWMMVDVEKLVETNILVI